jgi:hypothetical protein
MAVNYNSVDVDPDTLYEPKRPSDPSAPHTGYAVGGEDLNTKYAPISIGSGHPGQFGYAVGGVDFHQIFAAKGSIPRYNLPLPWDRVINLEATIYRQPSRGGYLGVNLMFSMSIHRDGQVVMTKAVPPYSSSFGEIAYSPAAPGGDVWSDEGPSPQSPYQVMFAQVGGPHITTSLAYNQPLGQWLEFMHNGIDHQTVFSGIGYNHAEAHGQKTGTVVVEVGVRRKNFPDSNKAVANYTINYVINVEPDLFSDWSYGGTYQVSNNNAANYSTPEGNVAQYNAGLLFVITGSRWIIYNAVWSGSGEPPWQVVKSGYWRRDSPIPTNDFEVLFTQIAGEFTGDDLILPMPAGWARLGANDWGYKSVLRVPSSNQPGTYAKDVSVNTRIRQFSTKDWVGTPDYFVEAATRFMPNVVLTAPVAPSWKNGPWYGMNAVHEIYHERDPNNPYTERMASIWMRFMPDGDCFIYNGVDGTAAPMGRWLPDGFDYSQISVQVSGNNLFSNPLSSPGIISARTDVIIAKVMYDNKKPAGVYEAISAVSVTVTRVAYQSHTHTTSGVGRATIIVSDKVNPITINPPGDYDNWATTIQNVVEYTLPSTGGGGGNSGGGGDSGGGGGDAGGPSGPNCILATCLLLRDDFTEVMAKDVRVGDKLLSITIPNLPDGSTKGWIKWTTDDISGVNYEVVTVLKTHHNTFGRYYIVNGTLAITKQHPIFVRRNGVWQWLDVDEIAKGDFLLSSEVVPVEVVSIEMKRGEVHVVDFNVESTDVYFAGGYLVHNAEEQPKDANG